MSDIRFEQVQPLWDAGSLPTGKGQGPREPGIEQVREFWDANPLWTGEAEAQPGSRAFFESHTAACIEMSGGVLSRHYFPALGKDEPVLDLGCGVGFWLEQFAERGWTNLTGADLSTRSLALARRRCSLLGIPARLEQQNAEAMTFADESFAHVNCVGVIHQSPRPDRSAAEIARVLRPGGTAVISVYYQNLALRLWPVLRPIAAGLGRLGVTLQGRGREDMMAARTAAELVRIYDGADNPIGTAYSKREFAAMLEPHFEVERLFVDTLPTRVLPFALPRPVFRAVEALCPFMVGAVVRKPR